MKKLTKVLGLLMLAFGSFAFGQTATFQQFKEVGKLHNEGLEHYYQKVVNNPANQSAIMSLNGIQSDISEFSQHNVSLKDFSKEVSDGAAKYNQQYLKNSLELLKGTSYEREVKIRTLLTDNQKVYFDQIMNVGNYSTASDYEKSIDDLMNQLSNDKKLNDEQKDQLYLSAGVGLSSFNYWEANAPKWVAITGQSASKLPPGFWKDFVKEDIKGGIAGGFGGALGGGVTIPVVGAVPGWVVGAVGGALMGSASWGIAELLWP